MVARADATGKRREPGRLTLADQPALVRVDPSQEAPNPLGQLILAQGPVAVLAEGHQPSDQQGGRNPRPRQALADSSMVSATFRDGK